MEGTMELLAYTRISTNEQVDNTSFEEQRDQINQYCSYKGYQVKDWYQEVCSGSSMDARPMLTQLIEDLEGADGIIVSKLDRLARSTHDLLGLTKDLEARGKSMIMLDLELDTSTPVGYFTMTVLAAVGELERKQIKQRTAAGKAARKAQGKFTGGGVPYGFQREGDALVENPEEQKTIQVMKRQRSSGKSYRRVAQYLNENGWLTRNGKNWYAPALKRILEANKR